MSTDFWSGVALAMRHRLQWFIHLLAHGLRKGDEHPLTLLMDMALLYLFTGFSDDCVYQNRPTIVVSLLPYFYTLIIICDMSILLPYLYVQYNSRYFVLLPRSSPSVVA